MNDKVVRYVLIENGTGHARIEQIEYDFDTAVDMYEIVEEQCNISSCDNWEVYDRYELIKIKEAIDYFLSKEMDERREQ